MTKQDSIKFFIESKEKSKIEKDRKPWKIDELIFISLLTRGNRKGLSPMNLSFTGSPWAALADKDRGVFEGSKVSKITWQSFHGIALMYLLFLPPCIYIPVHNPTSSYGILADEWAWDKVWVSHGHNDCVLEPSGASLSPIPGAFLHGVVWWASFPLVIYTEMSWELLCLSSPSTISPQK